MLVLGIDPGTAVTGYGIIMSDKGRLHAQGYGAVRTPSDWAESVRLYFLFEKLSEIIAEHRPDSVAVERLFFNRNVQSAMAVGQARGVAILAAAHAGLPVTEYTPTQVKVAVTGEGRAEKRQVQFMVARLLSLTDAPRPDDVADALAVAICHAHTKPWPAAAPAVRPPDRAAGEGLG